MSKTVILVFSWTLCKATPGTVGVRETFQFIPLSVTQTLLPGGSNIILL